MNLYLWSAVVSTLGVVLGALTSVLLSKKLREVPRVAAWSIYGAGMLLVLALSAWIGETRPASARGPYDGVLAAAVAVVGWCAGFLALRNGRGTR